MLPLPNPVTYACTALLTLLGIAAAISAPAAPPISDVSVTVLPEARQTFQGFGASCLNFDHGYQRLTLAQRQTLSQTFWHDLRFRVLRLWINTDSYAPTPGAHDLSQFRGCYVDSGLIADAKRNGATTLLLAPDHLPAYMAEKRADGSSETGMALKASAGDAYADLIAGFIGQLKQETGIRIDVTGIHNEPNDTFRFTPAQIVQVTKRLRADLDQGGLTQVQIIAPENSSANDVLEAQVDALKADPAAWSALAGIASHSYNMAATERIAQRIEGTGKSYWMTEASDNGPEVPGDALRAASLAARFLSDMNHRVTHWVHFVGYEAPDPKDNATRILYYTPTGVTRFQKYYTYRQLSRTFGVGCVFRRSQSTLDGDMIYTYGKKPRLTLAAARNPDGTWSVGLCNFTSTTFRDADDGKDFALHNSGYGAQAYRVTVHIPELAHAGVIRFAVRRTGSGVDDHVESPLVMRGGDMVVPQISPLDVICLRSLKNEIRH